jgi:hypothetical protein
MVKKVEPPFEAPPGTHWYDPEQLEQPPEQGEPKANGDDKHAILLREFEARDFTQIAMRSWEHAGHYIRRNVVMTVAPGAYGKTSLVLLNAIEMALGRGLIGPPPAKRVRVLYWNGEDPDDEILRRIAAICIRYQIDQHDLVGWLYLGGKLRMEQRLALLDRNQQLVINTEVLMGVEKYIGDHGIDCVIFDPLVAFHRVRESLNELMEQMVQTAFGGLAERRNCCIELCQHTRKSSQAARDGDLGVDDSRGGGSITNAARSVRVLNRMSKEDAKLPGFDDEERRQYLRVSQDKTNMLPASKASWIKLGSQQLPNGPDGGPGDNVQVVEKWNYPAPFDGVTVADLNWIRSAVLQGTYRKHRRSPDWVGKLLAKRLRLDVEKKSDAERISQILRKWFAERVLATAVRRDEKQRKDYEYIVPGDLNEGDASAPTFDE